MLVPSLLLIVVRFRPRVRVAITRDPPLLLTIISLHHAIPGGVARRDPLVTQ